MARRISISETQKIGKEKNLLDLDGFRLCQVKKYYK